MYLHTSKIFGDAEVEGNIWTGIDSTVKRGGSEALVGCK
jgi:hypothetical protein